MDNDVSQVIDRTDLVENLLNQVIHKYSSPRKEAFDFFWNILLDSSIIPLGSKIKLVMAISQELDIKLKHDSLHKIVSFRNAFAHHSLNSHQTIFVGKNPDEDQHYYMLQIITQSGKTKRIRREEALREFNNHYEIAKESLVELLEKIKNENK